MPSSRRDKAAQAPTGYSPSDFPPFAVTVDIVILTLVEGALAVLLVERAGQPFEGYWALPGGFKKPNETLDQAAQRELIEETGVEAPSHLEQSAAYGDPGRDPRMNVVTVAYAAVVRQLGEIIAGSDARRARLFPVEEVLNGHVDLAFDHHRILTDAVESVRRDLGESDLALSFVDEPFSLSDLRAVYEGIWGEKLDAANFRRSLISKAHSYVRRTGKKAPAGPDGGRWPELFTATDEWASGSPIRRPVRRNKPA